MVPFYLEDNHKAQQIARETLSELGEVLCEGMSEKEIHDFVCSRMREKGSGDFWYHGLGALVLLGDRGRLSISGREYVPDKNNRVSRKDIVTVDCSPTFNGAWGDFARTFFIEDGTAVPEDSVADPEFRRGLEAEMRLHQVLTNELNPDMTYHEIYTRITDEIRALGFENLDFHGNLGHSIEADEKDRVCLEAGNFESVRKHGRPITLEPHIAVPGSRFTFKRENIYYFTSDWFICL